MQVLSRYAASAFECIPSSDNSEYNTGFAQVRGFAVQDCVSLASNASMLFSASSMLDSVLDIVSLLEADSCCGRVDRCMSLQLFKCCIRGIRIFTPFQISSATTYYAQIWPVDVVRMLKFESDLWVWLHDTYRYAMRIWRHGQGSIFLIMKPRSGAAKNYNMM